LAQKLKLLGNKAYSRREFDAAVGHYTKAIAADPQAVFYSNRAACECRLEVGQALRTGGPSCTGTLLLPRRCA
jgi:hypothetical protein